MNEVDSEFYVLLKQTLGEDKFKSYMEFERLQHNSRINYAGNSQSFEEGVDANQTSDHADWVRCQIEQDRLTPSRPHLAHFQGVKSKHHEHLIIDNPYSVRQSLKRAFAEHRDRAVKEWEIE